MWYFLRGKENPVGWQQGVKHSTAPEPAPALPPLSPWFPWAPRLQHQFWQGKAAGTGAHLFWAHARCHGRDKKSHEPLGALRSHRTFCATGTSNSRFTQHHQEAAGFPVLSCTVLQNWKPFWLGVCLRPAAQQHTQPQGLAVKEHKWFKGDPQRKMFLRDFLKV